MGQLVQLLATKYFFAPLPLLKPYNLHFICLFVHETCALRSVFFFAHRLLIRAKWYILLVTVTVKV